ncbi:putative rhamnogalacturonate lyase C [Madurella mycetomatis]|uniref:Rhamnogalacturonate lyase C n=1 Tax=Madurella mycetomatis TaxID=100816 RepID=A0A175VP29_9PEZI|nr:putative rhamnogalacturonate lyase C [Madurella mycetomatis]
MGPLNKILVFLGLRRPPSEIFEPPTLLDHLLSSPLQYLVTKIYHTLLFLRGRPFRPPRNKRPIRVVVLSDTHNLTLPREAIPDGDVLIHCGDLTVDGTVEELQKQLNWLKSLGKFKYRLAIGGNHDVWFDPEQRKGVGMEGELDMAGIEYLCDSSLKLQFEGGRRLNVYGWGAIPRCGDGFAYQYERGNDIWRDRIPIETDVLITHTPPAYHLDLGLGCTSLLDEVWRVKPRLHIFGHVHWGRGKESVYYDKSQRAYESLMARPSSGFIYDLVPSVRWMDAFYVVRYGIGNLLWKWLMLGPGSNNGGLMVNAALMYGNTGRLGNRVAVVDL